MRFLQKFQRVYSLVLEEFSQASDESKVASSTPHSNDVERGTVDRTSSAEIRSSRLDEKTEVIDLNHAVDKTAAKISKGFDRLNARMDNLIRLLDQREKIRKEKKLSRSQVTGYDKQKESAPNVKSFNQERSV